MNIFQKIFLPRQQRVILDFIDKNWEAVQYTRVKEPGSFITHTVFIEAENMILSASLQKDVYLHPSMIHAIVASNVSYSLQCTKPCCNDECALQQTPVIKTASVNDKKQARFPLRVYNTMLSCYLIKMNDTTTNVK